MKTLYSKLVMYSEDTQLMLKLCCSILSKESLDFFAKSQISETGGVSSFFGNLVRAKNGDYLQYTSNFAEFCKGQVQDPSLMNFVVSCLRSWRIHNLEFYADSSSQKINMVVEDNQKIQNLIEWLACKSRMLMIKGGDELISKICVEFQLMEFFKPSVSFTSIDIADQTYFENMLQKTLNVRIRTHEIFHMYIKRAINTINYFYHIKSENFDNSIVFVFFRIKEFILSTKKQNNDFLDEIEEFVVFLINFKFIRNCEFISQRIYHILNIVYMLSLSFFDCNQSPESIDLSFLDSGDYVNMDIRTVVEEADLKIWFLSKLFLHNHKLIENVPEITIYISQQIEIIDYIVQSGFKNISIYNSLECLIQKIENSDFGEMYKIIVDKMNTMRGKLSNQKNLKEGGRLFYLVIDLVQILLRNGIKSSAQENFENCLFQGPLINQIKSIIRSMVDGLNLGQVDNFFMKRAQNSNFLSDSILNEKITIFDFFINIYNLGIFVEEHTISFNSLKIIGCIITSCSSLIPQNNYNLIKIWYYTKMAVITDKIRDLNHNIWKNIAWKELQRLIECDEKRTEDEHFVIFLSLMEIIQISQSSHPDKTKLQIKNLALMLDEYIIKHGDNIKPFIIFIGYIMVLVQFENCPIERSKLLKEIITAVKSLENFVEQSKQKLLQKKGSIMEQIFPSNTSFIVKGGKFDHESQFFKSFISKVVTSKNTITFHNFVRDCYNLSFSLSCELRFKKTSAKICKNAMVFYMKNGDVFKFMEIVSKRNYLMKMDQSEQEETKQLEYEDWGEQKEDVKKKRKQMVNLNIFEMIKTLKVDSGEIREMINDGKSLKSILENVYKKLCEWYPENLMTVSQNRSLLEFLLSYMIDLVSYEFQNLNSLYFCKEYRDQILKNIDGSNFMDLHTNTCFKNAQDLKIKLEKKIPQIIELLTVADVNYYTSDICQQVEQFIFELCINTDKMSRFQCFVMLEYLYKLILQKYLVFISKKDTSSDNFDYHVVLDKILSCMFQKYADIGNLEGMRKCLDFLINNFFQIEQIKPFFETREQFSPQNMNELFNKSILCSNIGHPIRILIKEDYLHLHQSTQIDGVKMKRMTIRNAKCITEFYKYSYFRLKLKKGNFRFEKSIRLSDYIFTLENEKIISIYGADNLNWSGEHCKKMHVIFNRGEDGSLCVYFDIKNVFGEFLGQFLNFEIEIEKQLRHHYKPGLKVNRDLVGRERKELNKQLGELFELFDEKLGDSKLFFTFEWQHCALTYPSYTFSYEENNQRLKTIVEEIKERKNKKIHIGRDQLNNQITYLILPGILSLIPIEHLAYFYKNSNQFVRIENTLKFSDNQANNQSQKRYSTVTLFDKVNTIEINKNPSSHCYYIINPEGSLSKSEVRLKNIFEGKRDWKGVIGRPPQSGEIADHLKQGYNLMQEINCFQLLRYCGHGDGEKYMNIDYLNRLTRLNNQVILMGCSSAAMFRLFDISRVRDVEHVSLTSEYLSSGSRLVFGNLWSVTDIDSDKITKKLAEEYIGNINNLEIKLQQVKEQELN